MTPKKAISTIRMAIAEVEWEYPMDYAVAFEMAIEALDKSNQWVSVEEQPPKFPCFTLDGNKGNLPRVTSCHVQIGKLHFDGDTVKDWSGVDPIRLFGDGCPVDWWINKTNSIRWWMPIPKTPEEKEVNDG
jgi:hypothetical protein